MSHAMKDFDHHPAACESKMRSSNSTVEFIGETRIDMRAQPVNNLGGIAEAQNEWVIPLRAPSHFQSYGRTNVEFRFNKLYFPFRWCSADY